MSDNGTEITTPVGRIVWGHPTKSRQKIDQDTNQPLFKDGVAVMEWSFGLAIPRAEFEQLVWPHMHAEAAKGYPNGTPPKFSFKYTDGDRDIDPKGNPYSAKEGYAGHIVLAISTVFQAPGIFKLEAGVFRQMEGNEIKCGDYVRCGINFKVNVPTKPTHTPSLYVNPLAIEFVGYGTEIKSGYVADPKALFAQPAALPPGASATPIGGAAPAAMPGMGAPPPVAPPAGGMPGAPAPVAPPPVAAPPPPPPAPAGPARPTDPTHIHLAGQPGEQWYINGAWTPAPAQAAAPPPPPAALPPPAAGFASPGGMPGAAPAGGMPGAMPGR